LARGSDSKKTNLFTSLATVALKSSALPSKKRVSHQPLLSSFSDTKSPLLPSSSPSAKKKVAFVDDDVDGIVEEDYYDDNVDNCNNNNNDEEYTYTSDSDDPNSACMIDGLLKVFRSNIMDHATAENFAIYFAKHYDLSTHFSQELRVLCVLYDVLSRQPRPCLSAIGKVAALATAIVMFKKDPSSGYELINEVTSRYVYNTASTKHQDLIHNLYTQIYKRQSVREKVLKASVTNSQTETIISILFPTLIIATHLSLTIVDLPETKMAIPTLLAQILFYFAFVSSSTTGHNKFC
jgi:hypothetical protein